MERFLNYASDVLRLLGYQRYNKDKSYIESPYLYNIRINDSNLIYNMLTREMIKMSDGELRGSTEYLVNRWFLLDKDIEPYSFVKSFKQIYEQQNKKKNIDKISSYTIFTTMKCNANCSYCYEKEYGNKNHMSLETAEKVVKFIRKNSASSINLSWFGGEPLFNSEVISYITKKLRDEGPSFTSSMISNGYLFHTIDMNEIKYIWNLKSVQITLDGTAEVYNRTKNYIYKENKDPFNTVLDNIELLVSNGIRVSVRMNMSKDNSDDLIALSKLLKDRFSKYNGFSAYSHSLFDEEKLRTDEEQQDIENKLLKVQNQLYDDGLLKMRKLDRVSICTHCMADNYSSIIINPEGKIGLCEHFCNSELIGDVEQTRFDKRKVEEWQEKLELPKCKTCKFFPRCNKIKKCPVDGCNSEDLKSQELLIRREMIKTYRRTEKNGK